MSPGWLSYTAFDANAAAFSRLMLMAIAPLGHCQISDPRT